ncbi:AMP-binding protein [Bordetella petrii]|nr:AMP-binding protein [Bordetella petrii]
MSVAESRPASRTLAGLLEEQAAARPDHPAILYQGAAISYGELRDAAFGLARSLQALGVRHGDRVGAMLGNQPEWVMMAMATAYLGAVFVPFNTWHKRTEIGWMLAHCRVSCFISVARYLNQDFAGILRDLLPELPACTPGDLRCGRFPALKTVVVLDGQLPGALTWNGLLALGAGSPAKAVREALAAVAPTDPAYILYTSGSTAEPKGVLLAHDGIVSNGHDMAVRRQIEAQDRVWLGSPLFYALGAANALPITLARGAALVLQGAFTAGSAIETIERTAATAYYGTGNMTRAILDHPDYRQSRIGSLQKGTAGTMAEYKRLTLVEMGIRKACAVYGLTESYGNATLSEADDDVDTKLHTCGRPLPGFELRVVDPQTGRPLKQGEAGLILLRGHTTPGYFENPAENARVMRPDGFFDTGDLGSLDAEGRLVFHARLKEVIKSGGINLSPMEIEQLLVQHPHINDAHVVAVPHPVRGQSVVAFAETNRALSEQEVREFVRERAASFKVPHHVFFRSESQLPRLASGKVAKHKLAQEAAEELGS